MMTAMTEVTIAMPPRVRESQILSDEYMSLAMPLRSNKAAMKMKRGTDIST